MSRRINERITERGGERIGIAVVGELGEKQFVAKTFGMRLATEKHEESADLRVGVNDDAVTQRKIGNDPAVERAAVAVDGRVNGPENLDVQDGALRQSVERIFGGGMETRLKMKGENGARGNTKGFDAGVGGGVRNGVESAGYLRGRNGSEHTGGA